MSPQRPIRNRFVRRPAGPLPESTVVLVTGTDPDGDAIARPVQWDDEGPPPLVLMAPEPAGRPALAPGERVLARLRPAGPGRYEGRTLKRLPGAPARVLGVFRPGPREGRIVPTDRRAKAEWIVPRGQEAGAQANEIVLAEPIAHHRLGLKPARVIERLGRMGDARSISLIAIATHDIPHAFPDQAVAEAAVAGPPTLAGREDLRDIPLVTIDGEDARDFDDAVFAESDGTGFRLIVAIADVAHYARPGSALDATALERGNSVYFPGPRRADAAGGAIQRLVQPASCAGPRLPVRGDAYRRRWPQAPAPIRPRPDAQRRAPDL